MFSAFNDGVVNDSVLAFNGAILHRENDVVDGVTLSGQVHALALNDLGDLAFVWGSTLFINDKKIAELGTLVDTDSDGLGDAGITNLTALGQLEISNLPAAGGDGLPVVYVGGRVAGSTAYMRLVPAFADFDNDGRVDGSDFLTWQRGLGVGSSQAEGDANGDGQVDAADLAIWQASYGKSNPGGSPVADVRAVPEPGTFWLAMMFVYWGHRFRGKPRPTESRE